MLVGVLAREEGMVGLFFFFLNVSPVASWRAIAVNNLNLHTGTYLVLVLPPPHTLAPRDLPLTGDRSRATDDVTRWLFYISVSPGWKVAMGGFPRVPNEGRHSDILPSI